jgi:hypothetical protein
MTIGEKNVGMIDRVIRIVIGIMLLAAALLNLVSAPFSYIVILLGIIALITSIFGTCPMYSAIGMNTAGKKA